MRWDKYQSWAFFRFLGGIMVSLLLVAICVAGIQAERKLPGQNIIVLMDVSTSMSTSNPETQGRDHAAGLVEYLGYQNDTEGADYCVGLAFFTDRLLKTESLQKPSQYLANVIREFKTETIFDRNHYLPALEFASGQATNPVCGNGRQTQVVIFTDSMPCLQSWECPEPKKSISSAYQENLNVYFARSGDLVTSFRSLMAKGIHVWVVAIGERADELKNWWVRDAESVHPDRYLVNPKPREIAIKLITDLPVFTQTSTTTPTPTHAPTGTPTATPTSTSTPTATPTSTSTPTKPGPVSIHIGSIEPTPFHPKLGDRLTATTLRSLFGPAKISQRRLELRRNGRSIMAGGPATEGTASVSLDPTECDSWWAWLDPRPMAHCASYVLTENIIIGPDEGDSIIVTVESPLELHRPLWATILALLGWSVALAILAVSSTRLIVFSIFLRMTFLATKLVRQGWDRLQRKPLIQTGATVILPPGSQRLAELTTEVVRRRAERRWRELQGKPDQLSHWRDVGSNRMLSKFEEAFYAFSIGFFDSSLSDEFVRTLGQSLGIGLNATRADQDYLYRLVDKTRQKDSTPNQQTAIAVALATWLSQNNDRQQAIQHYKLLLYHRIPFRVWFEMTVATRDRDWGELFRHTYLLLHGHETDILGKRRSEELDHVHTGLIKIQPNAAEVAWNEIISWSDRGLMDALPQWPTNDQENLPRVTLELASVSEAMRNRMKYGQYDVWATLLDEPPISDQVRIFDIHWELLRSSTDAIRPEEIAPLEISDNECVQIEFWGYNHPPIKIISQFDWRLNSARREWPFKIVFHCEPKSESFLKTLFRGLSDQIVFRSDYPNQRQGLPKNVTPTGEQPSVTAEPISDCLDVKIWIDYEDSRGIHSSPAILVPVKIVR